MAGTCNSKLFVLSFTVGKEAGIALVAAGSERQAFEILQNSGNYNGFPEKYVLVQSRNIGLIASVAYGLLIESYVNALEAYDAIIKAANRLIGPKGDKGDVGDTGMSAYEIAVKYGFVGTEEEWINSIVSVVVKNDFSGGTVEALSAEMGKNLNTRLGNAVFLGQVVETL